MKKLFLSLTIMAALLAACASAAEGSLNQPVSSDDPQQPEPAADDFLPRPEDAALQREVVFVEKTDLLTLEMYPPRFDLILAGNLPTPCNQLRVKVNPPNAQNEIHVDVYSVIDPATMCVEVIQPFEANVSLGTFPAGRYTLLVNGEKVAEFETR